MPVTPTGLGNDRYVQFQGGEVYEIGFQDQENYVAVFGRPSSSPLRGVITSIRKAEGIDLSRTGESGVYRFYAKPGYDTQTLAANIIAQLVEDSFLTPVQAQIAYAELKLTPTKGSRSVNDESRMSR